MNKNIIQLHQVSFSYPSHSMEVNGKLYENFSLSIQEKSIITVMGSSGSGKSTLGKLLAGIVKPQNGVVNISDQIKSKSEVVYIDQNPMNSVFPWMNVKNNLVYPLKKLKWAPQKRKERVSFLMGLFRLEHLRNFYPANLSGGELQRLALARCLSWRPQLIILDESFSALDRKMKSEILKKIYELTIQDESTIVLITHNISDALALGTRCVVVGNRPVEIIADLEIKANYPRDEEAEDYLKAQEALIEVLRHGLI